MGIADSYKLLVLDRESIFKKFAGFKEAFYLHDTNRVIHGIEEMLMSIADPISDLADDDVVKLTDHIQFLASSPDHDAFIEERRQ